MFSWRNEKNILKPSYLEVCPVNLDCSITYHSLFGAVNLNHFEYNTDSVYVNITVCHCHNVVKGTFDFLYAGDDFFYFIFFPEKCIKQACYTSLMFMFIRNLIGRVHIKCRVIVCHVTL